MFDTGDTAFILICAAMVFAMTPALAVFYAGLVRKKNAVDIMTQVLAAIGAVALTWFLVGFSIAFGDDVGGVLGSLKYSFLQGVGAEPDATFGSTIPFILFCALQMMYAIITPALVLGTIAERVTMKASIAFLVCWSVLVYAPLCHWVWGGGFLASMGLADFAGGTVVHMSAGFSALAAYMCVKGRRRRDFTPHNTGLAAVGAGIVLFGWMAFNGGSALGANEIAAYAIANTTISIGTGMLMWMIISYAINRKLSGIGCLMGALAGAVVVTPGAGFVEPWAAAIMGVIGGLVCFACIEFRSRKGMDDTLDVWGLHGMGGLTGLILTGIFASPSVGAYTGAIYGNPMQILYQLAGCGVAAGYCFALTLIMFKIIGAITPLRVKPQIEEAGIDKECYLEEIAIYYEDSPKL